MKARRAASEALPEPEVNVPPGCAAWITAQLLAHTIRVWQPYYATPLSAEDAADILGSVGRLLDACAALE